MTEDERWKYFLALDDELLISGVTVSEWCAFIVREADTAFAKGAHLASILTATSAIETYLRAEGDGGRKSLNERIDDANFPEDLTSDLHKLRLYRNEWVHVDDPGNDRIVLERPEEIEMELEQMAVLAARILRRVLYSNQWI